MTMPRRCRLASPRHGTRLHGCDRGGRFGDSEGSCGSSGRVEGSPWTSALGVVPGRTEEEERPYMADWLMGAICDKSQSPCKVMESKGSRK